MEIEVKQRNSQRNRRRERAQRILAQRESLASAKNHNLSHQVRQRPGDDEDSHSGEDEETLGLSRSSGPRDGHQRPVRPPRPPRPRKKSSIAGGGAKEPPFEEDIIDGFAILAFRSYEDLESAIKLAGKNNLKKLHTLLTIEEKPKVDTGQNNRHNDHHIKNHFKPNHYTHNSILTPSTLNQGLDAGTSDDSGRASEQLHGPGIPRDSQDADSSRDHLSDASSHCSSGKGYICDSEGEDDKGSDAESILFESSTPPLPRKYELPSSSPHVLPPANGAGGTPPDTGGQISNPATDAPAPIPPPVPASAPVPTAPSPPSPTLPPHISQPPMTSPLAANPRAIAPQQRPASPAHPPPSLPQQPHTTIPALHPPNVPLVSSSHNTTSPAVASLGVTPAAPSNGAATTSYPPSLPMAAYPQSQPSYPPLYTPYASLNHSPYLSPAVPSPSHSASSRADVRSSRASPHTNSIAKPPLGNNVTTHNSSTPLSAATTTCVSTITNTVTTANTIAHRDIVTCSLAGRINNNNSPRGHSPNRERDSYSSNVSTLSRGSITPVSVPNTSSPANSSLPAYSKAQGWISSTSSQLSPATGTSVPRPTPPPPSAALGMHNFPPPMFAAPLPPPVSSSSPHTSLPSLPPPTTNPNPFSAESLFQTRVTHVTGQTDLLRRELDNRFLASSQDRNVAVSNLGPPPYLRTEMHHHQHQHTHVHQHTTPLLPPPAATTLFPPPIFKDIPKLGSVDSPFFRGNLNLSSYPGFNAGLLHPGMGPSTPFVPPNHLTSYAPKKTGKWNAMHVRIAWEIYHHQQKQQAEAKAGGVVATKTELLRPPGHLYPGGPPGGLGLGGPSLAPPFPSNMPPSHPGAPPPPHPVGFLSTSASHLGSGMSPFGRYPASYGGGNPNFPTLSAFPPTRDISQLSGLTSAVHDPWRGLQRANPGFPPTTVSWTLKPEPPSIDRRAELEERERERERQRREREELERQRREREREREEHERQRREREELERQRREREREEQRERERREREKEEKRKQQEAAERERERERRDKERRELERREMERERLMHQNRQHAMMGRDRSPLRNGTLDPSEVRVKEEPRSKDDDVVMLSRGPSVPGPGLSQGPSPIPDPRYHHPHHAYLARHPHSIPHGMSRTMMPLGHPMQHFQPPPPPPSASGPGQPPGPWTPDPFRDPYRYDALQQLRYNPLMAAAAFRAEEEERAKLYAGYNQNVAALRGKDPSPGPLSNLHMHHRAGPGPGNASRQVDGIIHAEMHKKEDSSQSR
ncbi:autism susceptibility gene 2 protein-like isoform X3 [Diachasmimorpha longicaudata]|uniref:autism susceptibility gene 2 protein-like isoform X3 n=1 Tax=Diachasmimorpha longicaudata TaxID=58733 RepID=UPI0030B892DA